MKLSRVEITRHESLHIILTTSSFQSCTTKQTQLHRKLLLEHKKLSDKYKLLRARLDIMGTTLPSDIVVMSTSLDFMTNFLSFTDINSRVGS